jgi:hypothetical protein
MHEWGTYVKFTEAGAALFANAGLLPIFAMAIFSARARPGPGTSKSDE